MEFNELMIGDYVRYIGTGYCDIVKVYTLQYPRYVGIGDNCMADDWLFEPIPLTAEILERNGFEHKHIGEPQKRQYWIINAAGCEVKAKINRELFLFNICGKPFKDGFFCPSFNGHIRYVHELQHALKLCGIEKEIEL